MAALMIKSENDIVLEKYGNKFSVIHAPTECYLCSCSKYRKSLGSVNINVPGHSVIRILVEDENSIIHNVTKWLVDNGYLAFE